MNIEIMFFGKLRDLAGIHKEEVDLETNARLSDLINRLGEKHGDGFCTKIKDMEGLRILINGREYQILDGFDTRLNERDAVVFLPLIEGG
ncbi:MAG: MoaD family protein [Chloroflexota bacterium]